MFVDHIVLIVSDINRTEGFYSSFLGQPARITDKSVVYDIHGVKIFFKLPYNGTFVKADKDSSGVNHIAFGIETMEELRHYGKLLDDAEITHSGIKKDPKTGKDYIWLDDPDGYRVELYLRGHDRGLVAL